MRKVCVSASTFWVPADSGRSSNSVMLASATEVEVELHVPDDVSTFFGVTWVQDPRKNKVGAARRPVGLLRSLQKRVCGCARVDTRTAYSSSTTGEGGRCWRRLCNIQDAAAVTACVCAFL